MAGVASLRPTAAGLAAAVLLAVPSFAAAAGPPVPSVAPCALGTLEPSARVAIPAALAREEARFAARFRGPSGARRRAFARRYLGTAVAAHLYGLAPVALNRTVQRFPRNAIVGIAQLAGPDTRAVVAPNHDTAYSVGRLELDDGPLVVDLPDAGRRYAVLALLDAYTNDFAYLDARTAAGGARSVAILPPGWRGSLPAGVRRVESPTRLIWLLGRTLVDGPHDMPGARRVMAAHALTPLAAWAGGEHKPALILDAFPADTRAALALPRGVAFLDALAAILRTDPPPARDACALRAFARVAIEPGRSLVEGAARNPVLRLALAAAPRIGERLAQLALELEERASRRRNRGWLVPSDQLGRYGRGYLYRAGVALNGLGANTRREADYPRATRDIDGRRLDGRHRYVIRFAPGELPPVRAFWSLTVYDRRSFLVDNPIDRYAVGDRTPGLRRARDGSLTVYVQRTAPRGAARRANWLPAPAGPFRLTLRLYEPRPAALGGRWKPPAIRRTG